jgi:hypothetical protein
MNGVKLGIALAALGFSPGAFAVDVLRVEIGRSDQRVDPTFAAFNMPSPTEADVTQSFNRLDNGQNVSVKISNERYDISDAGGRAQPPDPLTPPQPLETLIEDFFKVDTGTITLTFTGLGAAEYSLTSYHNAPLSGNNHGILDLEVMDATRPTFTEVVSNLDPSQTRNPALATKGTFSFTSNGSDPVAFRVRQVDPNDTTLINGFILTVPGLAGDFNSDGSGNATDIDLLCDRINAGTGPVSPFDVNGDGSVNNADVNFEVTSILHTKFGDTDTDGDVDLNDLGNLASGFGQPGEKRWSRGNFDCDNDVDLPDLGTLATNFQGGRAAAFAEFQALVPEPTFAAGLLAGVGLLICAVPRRR